MVELEVCVDYLQMDLSGIRYVICIRCSGGRLELEN